MAERVVDVMGVVRELREKRNDMVSGTGKDWARHDTHDIPCNQCGLYCNVFVEGCLQNVLFTVHCIDPRIVCVCVTVCKAWHTWE